MTLRAPRLWLALSGVLVSAASVCLAQAQVLEDCCSVVNPWADLAPQAVPVANAPALPLAQPVARPVVQPAALQVPARSASPAGREIELVPMIRPVPGFDSVPDAPAAPGIVNPWSTGAAAARAPRSEIVDPWSDGDPRVPTAAFPDIE